VSAATNHLSNTPAVNDNLSIHEDKTRGVYVKGLTDVYVGSEAEVFQVMKAGGASRAVSSTSEFQGSRQYPTHTQI
jgi:hypothetical protein